MFQIKTHQLKHAVTAIKKRDSFGFSKANMQNKAPRISKT